MTTLYSNHDYDNGDDDQHDVILIKEDAIPFSQQHYHNGGQNIQETQSQTQTQIEDSKTQQQYQLSLNQLRIFKNSTRPMSRRSSLLVDVSINGNHNRSIRNNNQSRTATTVTTENVNAFCDLEQLLDSYQSDQENYDKENVYNNDRNNSHDANMGSSSQIHISNKKVDHTIDTCKDDDISQKNNQRRKRNDILRDQHRLSLSTVKHIPVDENRSKCNTKSTRRRCSTNALVSNAEISTPLPPFTIIQHSNSIVGSRYVTKII
jgi:hypothetical protein